MADRRTRFAFYGDDVTGSIDALLQFARGGWSGRLFVGTPSSAALTRAAREVDVVGIAGIARSLGTDALDAEVRPALDALLSTGAAVVQYKACSTADSSPVTGSLGRVLEIGREVVGDAPVPMLFAQPDFGRYTLFGHHFAAEDGIVHRLDRQPTMAHHPVTPMTESDLRRHLGAQTALPIGSVSYPAYTDARGLAAEIAATGTAGVVLDAADRAHVDLVGRAILGLPHPVFAIGSGGLSFGLARAEPGGAVALPRATPARGAVLAVSGSRSARTRAQRDAAADAGWHVAPLPLAPGPAQIAEIVARLSAGVSVVLTSDDTELPETTPALAAIARAAASVIAGAARADATRRVIVCGGDTSSRVTRLLGVTALSIAANPAGNVVLCTAHAADPAVDGLELLLKGGQVGDDDLFERIRRLGG